jgi:hypothetical protein
MAGSMMGQHAHDTIDISRAWRFGLTVREYRELEAGTRSPTFETWDRICARTAGRRRK